MSNNRTNYEKIDIARVQEYIDDIFKDQKSVSIISEVLKDIAEKKDTIIDLLEINYDDETVFSYLNTHDIESIMPSDGIFSQNLIEVNSIEEMTAELALNRPGLEERCAKYIVNKNNPDHIQYECSELERILSSTYGLVLYKEQVMQIFEKLGGFSREQSDFARRDASKKKLSALSEIKDDFVNGNKEKGISGCRANGLEENTAKQIFEKVCAAAPYSFTRLHGVECAVLVYQMVWLKVHYESEYNIVKAKIG